MAIVYLGIGSNSGDRLGNIQQATVLLKDTEHITLVQTSSLYETEPYGFKDQPWFINAAIEIHTPLTPYELLKECQRIEAQLGRVRQTGAPKWGPRTIDIDILFYNNEIITTDVLTIPHSEIQNRAFVLVPLLELIPDYVHPVLEKTLLELHDELECPEEVYLYGTRINGI